MNNEPESRVKLPEEIAKEMGAESLEQAKDSLIETFGTVQALLARCDQQLQDIEDARRDVTLTKMGHSFHLARLQATAMRLGFDLNTATVDSSQTMLPFEPNPDNKTKG